MPGAGSTYAQGGVAVRAAADDTERLRTIFVRAIGRPKTTILHGQSWGASVAAKAAEAHPGSYDGVLLTSGVLGGGTRSYDFRLDLRVVWQAVCANHPLPSEPQYALWQGLPLDAKLTRAELARRVDACTGWSKQPAERTPEQQRRLETILRVVRIPERSLPGHLQWATWGFQDIAFERLDGGDAFGNLGAHYTGSPDDAALNAQVARYRAAPAAVARLAADTDPTGAIGVPVLDLHAIDDPTAFVELESTFRDTMTAGRARRQSGADLHRRARAQLPRRSGVRRRGAGPARLDRPRPQAHARRHRRALPRARERLPRRMPRRAGLSAGAARDPDHAAIRRFAMSGARCRIEAPIPPGTGPSTTVKSAHRPGPTGHIDTTISLARLQKPVERSRTPRPCPNCRNRSSGT